MERTPTFPRQVVYLPSAASPDVQFNIDNAMPPFRVISDICLTLVLLCSQIKQDRGAVTSVERNSLHIIISKYTDEFTLERSRTAVNNVGKASL